MYRHFPLLDKHPHAQCEAEASVVCRNVRSGHRVWSQGDAHFICHNVLLFNNDELEQTLEHVTNDRNQ